MKLVMMGPQGSGKGTHAKRLAERMEIQHVSTGDICRQVAAENTALGRKVRETINKGVLIPDEMMAEMLEKKLPEDFILDGFPRNIAQAKMLEKIAKIGKVLYLNVSDKECLRRLSGRWTCKKCGAIYGNEAKPKKAGRCDKCGSALFQREDETGKAIKKRLSIYHKQTEPVLDHYRKKGILAEVKVAGIKTPDEVFAGICRALGI